MQEEKKLGTLEIIDSAVDVIETADALVEAFADGVQITDLAVLLGIAPKIQDLAKTGRQAIDELLDLTADEADEAVAEIARRTGKNASTVVHQVNEAFGLCARTYRVYTSARNVAFDWQRFAKSFDKNAIA